MTRDEIESKFRGNASLVMPTDQASRVVQAVDALATEPNLGTLMASLIL